MSSIIYSARRTNLSTGQVRRQLAQDMVKILAAPPNNLTERARRQLGATIQ